MRGDIGNRGGWVNSKMPKMLRTDARTAWPVARRSGQDQSMPPITDKAKTVEIKLDFSLLTKLHLSARLRRLWKRLLVLPKPVLVGAIALAGLATVIIFGYRVWLQHPSSPLAVSASSQPRSGPTAGTPTYTTILPAGKGIQALGGWYLISPPGRDPVYAYADSIGGVHIDVSEQPLPDSFKTNTTAQLNQLALSFNASQKLTAGGVTIYLGTSAKGPQSLIFTKNDLLILIKSATIITNNQWIQYVNSLQ